MNWTKSLMLLGLVTGLTWVEAPGTAQADDHNRVSKHHHGEGARVRKMGRGRRQRRKARKERRHAHHARPRENRMDAPELDPSSAGSALALLLAAGTLVRIRRQDPIG